MSAQPPSDYPISTPAEVRCAHCSALLARRDASGLAVRRGGMQLHINGPYFAVSITCYRCGTLAVVQSMRVVHVTTA